jgi:hypothetical protein
MNRVLYFEIPGNSLSSNGRILMNSGQTTILLVQDDSKTLDLLWSCHRLVAMRTQTHTDS